MAITNAFASVAVRDLNAAARWYEGILEQAPSRPVPGVAEWSFTGGGRLQVYELPQRAGSGSCTLLVRDIETHIAHLEKLDIDVGERPANSQVKTVMITDPDGNHIAFAEPLAH